MSAICWPPSSPPASRPAAPTPARSKPSSARLEHSANPTPSTQPRLPDTGGTATPNFRFGAPASPERERLQALVLARRDLVKDRLAYANRRAPAAEPVRPYLDALVESFETQINAIEADIKTLRAACEPIAKAVNVLVAIPGVGQKTAAALIALMPELGSLFRRQAAALAGLAPHPNQSGQSDAYRRTRGGRPEVKRILFMAAISAAKHNPTLSASYKRLISAGKKPVVAITAIMRKLVVIANARPKTATPLNLS
jgi:transposase